MVNGSQASQGEQGREALDICNLITSSLFGFVLVHPCMAHVGDVIICAPGLG